MNDWSGYFYLLLDGTWVTIKLTIMGSVVAIICAFIAGLGKISKIVWLRVLANIYIEFFRGTSIFVQLFWMFFVLPLMGIKLSPITAGVLALGLNVGAYAAEVVRGAIEAIPRDQREACTALNLTSWQKMRHIILPQAFVLMLPSFGNNAIELLKGTAVVSLITITDMTFQAQVIRSATGNTILPFVAILILYYLIAMTITLSVRKLEQRLSLGLDVTKS
ncbi:ectoine/hydroxyectoine ABC transporter permease subunit EhuC [Pseudomonas serbica]|jgi:polar amino acid transport system permease protein